jgi:glycosyltransferase involved in cell wall biosynthesis
MHDAEEYDFIVFSQLRWHSVTQRPQHIMTRLAVDHKILFIEEPVEPTDGFPDGYARLEKISGSINVLTPHIPWADWVDMSEAYIKMLPEYVANPEHCVAWVYSPLYAKIIEAFPFALIVYDCMDELSGFKGASVDLPSYEEVLLSKAQIVFTGGKSLFEAKSKHHENVYCFPSSVDVLHFESANHEATVIPHDLAELAGPVVGYYGVIDERINLELIGEVASALPYVTFVMIGPFSKIDPATISHPSNVHYLGMKHYSELPSYLKGIDIAMMPFALNEATRFISPTKTLEFMAAGKPVISTPVFDVVRDYTDTIAIVESAAQFKDAITKFLSESESEKAKRVVRYASILEKTSWDNTVRQMKKHVREMLPENSEVDQEGLW